MSVDSLAYVLEVDGEAWGSSLIGHSRRSSVVPGRIRSGEGTDWVEPIDDCIRPLLHSRSSRLKIDFGGRQASVHLLITLRSVRLWTIGAEIGGSICVGTMPGGHSSESTTHA